MKSNNKIISKALDLCEETFENFDEVSIYNQKKVLDAFSKNRVAARHFVGSTGYGHDDEGKDVLCKTISDIFHTESCVAGPLIVSGTHAISIALFGVLRPNDIAVSICGQPYDTLYDTIWGKNNGSLADFGVKFECIPLKNFKPDLDALDEFLKKNATKMVYIQRSRGYDWRPALSIEQIEQIVNVVRRVSPETVVFCDNCYGEFTEKMEPTDVGVDLAAGSFIKNIGGGISPTGGYVVGKQLLIEGVAGRLTSPSVGMDNGSYTGGYRLFYQGLFNAPHVVNQALKTALLFATSLNLLGYDVMPKIGDNIDDIVCSIKLGDSQKIIKFCEAIQSISPVDSYVSPVPSEMAGYADQVIMAAGCFVQGSSIELSCDAPIRSPYILYLQGGLTFEHGILACEKVISMLEK